MYEYFLHQAQVDIRKNNIAQTENQIRIDELHRKELEEELLQLNRELTGKQ